jgi:putative PIN family toxin of toxin-antitoxin system
MPRARNAVIRAVIDTNVLVSALLSPNGLPSQILAMMLNGQIAICYDSRIMLEYEIVLLRDKFHFESQDISILLNTILHLGTSIVSKSNNIVFLDEDDKKFYEVAKKARTFLITGNTRHFPDDPCVVSPADFLRCATKDI